MKIRFPQNIALSNPERYFLTIYIHPDRFSFSIDNPSDAGSFFYHEVMEGKNADAFSNFREFFFENDFFTFAFGKIRVMNNTSVFTYVPSVIYEEKYKNDFMKFLFAENTGKILSHTVRNEITVLHQIPEETYNFFSRSFINPEFIHHSAPMIAYFLEKSKLSPTKQMLVNKNGNGLDILCFSKGTFLLGNHFPCEHLQDAVYYTLFIWKQLKFNQLKDSLHIVGDAVSKGELSNLLGTYICHVIPFDLASETHFEQIDTENIPFELIALKLCEL
jgi:hypothetical protein